MAKGDVVKACMREMLAANPSMTARDALAVECRIREVWGGSKVYVCKGTALGKAFRLGADLAAGATLHEAFERVGLSRRSGYRALSRKWYVR